MTTAWDIDNHLRKFPHVFAGEKDGSLYVTWKEGNMYRRINGYHGEYPPSYLRRIKSLFPYRSSILHVFSGSIQGDTTFDINPSLNPDIVGSAEELSKYFDEGSFDLVLADPPYTRKDAEVYGYKMPRKNIVMQEIRKIISLDGVLIWMDLRPPMYRKNEWINSGVISYHCGTNRVFRYVGVYEPI